MNGAAGDEEQRCPDTTVNPLLHRFFSFIASLAVDPANQVPEQDPLMESTINADTGSSEAQASLQRLAGLFPLKAGVGSVFTVYSTMIYAMLSGWAP